VDGTGSKLCTILHSGVSSVGPLGSITIVLRQLFQMAEKCKEANTIICGIPP